MLLLTSIGLWMIFEPYLKKDNDLTDQPTQGNRKNALHVLLNPHDADMDNSKRIDFREATFFGIALSINNEGEGLSAGIIGLNSFWVGFIAAPVFLDTILC